MINFQIYKTHIKPQKPALIKPIKPAGLGFMIKPGFYANFKILTQNTMKTFVLKIFTQNTMKTFALKILTQNTMNTFVLKILTQNTMKTCALKILTQNTMKTVI